MGKIKINLNTIKTIDNISKDNINKEKLESPPDENLVKTNISKDNINKEKLESSPDENLVKTNISKDNINKEKLESPPDENLVELKKPIEKEESIIKKKIGISSIKKKDKKVEEIKKKNDVNNIDKDIPIKNNIEVKPLFNNYESVFKKDKVPILEHIKKLKGLPKTNILLLTILTSVTIAGIGFLFYSNPKIHNLDNYKTSIMDTYNAITSTGNTSLSNIKKPPTFKKINKGGYIYNVEIKKILGKEVYVYKGKYFDNKDKFYKFIDKETESRKKTKVALTLKNSFLK